jgi:hypothetical protein
MDSSFSCSVLTTLTGLTSLSLMWPRKRDSAHGSSNVEQQQQQQQEMRHQGQQLQLAISHLKHLKELVISDTLVPASTATTLAQLTGLTALFMESMEPDESWNARAFHNPVTLPSVQHLLLYGQGALHFLAGTHLPQLASLSLDIQLSQGIQQAHLLHDQAAMLQPLAQLRNLKELWLNDCTGLPTSCLESFFRAAVQGSGLEVIVDRSCLEEGGLEQLKATYDSHVQARGANNVPTLRH